MNLDDLLQLKAIPLLFVACNVIGMVLKKSPVQNWLIPWVLLIIGAVTYPFISDPGDAPYAMRSPLVHSMLIGAIIGWASVGGHQALSALRESVGQRTDGGTTFMKKPEPTPTLGTLSLGGRSDTTPGGSSNPPPNEPPKSNP